MGAAERTNPRNLRLATSIEGALQGGPARLIDRFGRPIVIGGQYEFHDSLPIVFTVEDIVPDLRPEAQAGVFFVSLKAALTLPAMNNVPVVSMTMVIGPKPTAPPAETATPATTEQTTDTPAAETSIEPSPSLILTDADRFPPTTGDLQSPAASTLGGDPEKGGA